jgi:glycosyltransferase involved in cell wall biosynthesis
MDISIILPVLNEQEAIEKVLLSILKQKISGIANYEIIVVNDGSTDNSGKILSKLKEKINNLKIVTHTINKGYGAAFKSGVRTAKYNWILFMDSDMQFHINSIKPFLTFTKDFDYIVGYRQNRADNIRRKIVSFIYNRLVRIIFGLPIRDVDCAFKLMRKDSVSKVRGLPDSFFVSAALLIKSMQMKIKIKELPVRHLPRTKGISTVTISKVTRTIYDLTMLYKETILKRFIKTSSKKLGNTNKVARKYAVQLMLIVLAILYYQNREK